MTTLSRLGAGALILCVAAAAGHARKMTGDNLSNIIIQGENRLKVSPRVPPVEWSADAYRDIHHVFEYNALLAGLKPPSIGRPPLILPEKSATGKTASPWLTRIYEPPVLTLTFKAEEKVGSGDWVFLVKDSQGRTFFEMRKKGTPPPDIKWNGHGTNGMPLRVGYDYTYSFSAVDEAGNPQRYAGKPFRLNAFRYTKSGKTITSFQPEALFTGRASVKFSADGQQYLAEVKDMLRPTFGQKIDVISYDEDPKFAAARAKAVRDFLLKALDYPEDKITSTGLTAAQGGGYRHVDIVAK
jgi:hypothetical protein